MLASSFPLCCAGIIFSDFGGTSLTSGTPMTRSPAEIEAWLVSHESSYTNKGFFLIAINTEQNKHMSPILKKLKYKCVAKNIKSKGHPQSAVFLWLKAQYKDG